MLNERQARKLLERMRTDIADPYQRGKQDMLKMIINNNNWPVSRILKVMGQQE